MLNEIGIKPDITEEHPAIIIHIPESIYANHSQNPKSTDIPPSTFPLLISNMPNCNIQPQNQAEKNNNSLTTYENEIQTKVSNRRLSKFNNPLNPAGRRRGVNLKSDKYGTKDTKRELSMIRNSSSSWLPQNSRLLNLFEAILACKVFDFLVVVSIFLALFITEIKNIFTLKEDELPFTIIYALIIALYLGQTVLCSVAQKDFWFSIRFYIDILVLFTWTIENTGWVEDIVHLIYPSLLKIYVLKISKQLDYYYWGFNIISITKKTWIVKCISIFSSILHKREVKWKITEMLQRMKWREKNERKRIEEKNLISSAWLNDSNTMLNNYTENKHNSIKKNHSITLNTGAKTNSKEKLAIVNKNKNTESNHNWLNQTNSFNLPMRSLSNQYNLKQLNLRYVKTSTQTSLSNNKEERLPHADEVTPEHAWLILMKSNYIKEKKKLECEIESKMTKIVAKKVTERLIVIILVWLLVFPVLDVNNFVDTLNVSKLQYLCDILNTEVILNNGVSTGFNRSWYNLLEGTGEHWFCRVINITYINPNLVLYRNATLNTSYRFFEIGYSYFNNGNIWITYSNKDYSKVFSIVNIVSVVLIGGVLLTISFFILQDTKNLILEPLVIMISTINVVAKDPVNYRSLEKLNKVMSGFIAIKNNKSANKSDSIGRSKSRCRNRSDSNGNSDTKLIDVEIKTIQHAVIRISSLIAIGFGEAGGQIWKENMNSSEGLNPMWEGKKVESIFGFCLIRNFAEINEALQEKTILFVNDIADIVHMNVFKFGGVCNKNIGESFLWVWKFPDWDKKLVKCILDNYSKSVNHKHKIKQQIIWRRTAPKMKTKFLEISASTEAPRKADFVNSDNTISLSRKIDFNRSHQPHDSVKPVNQSLTWTADCAVWSFWNIIKKIRKSPKILKYGTDVNWLKVSENKAHKKPFRVKMGFGLHVGWGIEGAIGSFYKIDCSYWSPNVNIAARWETATNIYGVELWWSGEWHNLLSPSWQSKCREIDTVTWKGSINPVSWFTFDVNAKITRGKVKDDANVTGKERRIINDMKKIRLFKEYRKENQNEIVSIDSIYLKESAGWRNLLRNPKSEIFKCCFESGYQAYLLGDWGSAYWMLKQAIYIDTRDGPTKCLIKMIWKNNKIAPNDWKGYRAWSSKC